MARVASRGVSGVIDAYGRQIATASSPDGGANTGDPKGWKARILDAQVPSELTETYFNKTHGFLAIIALLLVVFGYLYMPQELKFSLSDHDLVRT